MTVSPTVMRRGLTFVQLMWSSRMQSAQPTPHLFGLDQRNTVFHFLVAYLAEVVYPIRLLHCDISTTREFLSSNLSETTSIMVTMVMTMTNEVLAQLPSFTLPHAVRLPCQTWNKRISSTRHDLRVSRRRVQITGCATANNIASNGAVPTNAASNGTAPTNVATNGTVPPSPLPPPVKSDVHPSWRVYYTEDDCVVCQGKGKTLCLYCFGEGSIVIGAQASRDTVPCPHCMGACYEICDRCEGTGKRPLTRYDPKTKTEVRNRTNRELREPKNKQVSEVEQSEELTAAHQN